MTRDELFASIVAAGPGRDDLVYLQRYGEAYEWRTVTAWPLHEPWLQHYH